MTEELLSGYATYAGADEIRDVSTEDMDAPHTNSTITYTIPFTIALTNWVAC